MIFDTTIISNIQQEVQAFKRIFIDELSEMKQRVLDIEQQMESKTTSGMHTISRKSKLLLSVQNQVFQESLFSELNYLKFALIDMSDEKFVTLDQKCQIAKQLLSNGDEDDVYLIDYGRQMNIFTYEPDINQKDSFGRRPLIVAVQNDHPVVVEILISKGADINLGDLNGRTPFLWACMLHREDVAKLLMKHGANVNQASNDKSTPLFWCSVMGFQSFVVLLHEKGAKGSLSISNTDGKTPLMAACYFRQQEIVTYLLKHLKCVDESDNEGWTSLMEACFDNDTGSWDKFLDQFETGDGLLLPHLKAESKRFLSYNDSLGRIP
ncbi:unnamed protein product [Mytilus edulis]|uniref:Uncharacterized protein n=1 Tax=Mytilus edulis TaxID=6550 RepID=A0A8S3V2A8_MYTED|nr:unnamed protein product [Mytilus edulis]